MQIPLLDVKAQLEPLLPELKSAMAGVLESGHFILGPYVEQFEKELQSYLQVRHCIGVSSGSDALLMCLMALDVGPGDVVITPDYSFFATAGAVSRLGATPYFVDIDAVTYNISPEALEQALVSMGEKGIRPKAIIPVHLYGQSADMLAICALAEQHEVPIIEDAAQSLGASFIMGGVVKPVGTIGTFGCYSFFPSKNLGGVGDGGLVVTNNDAMADKLRVLRVHGSKPKYYHSMIGGNFRLDALQAAVLSVKLPHLQRWQLGRQKNAAWYDEHLTCQHLVKPVNVVGPGHHVYNQYVVSVPHRDALMSFLAERGIATAIYYPVPFCEQECFRDVPCDKSLLKNSIYAAKHSLALPVYPEMTQEMLAHVVESIGAFYGE
jgi:dTDP-4-amino-4,6-dideoxygalactose transaminase